MLAKKIKTTETFILPEEFDHYTMLGYVIFLSKPTVFGTYRAIKIEVVKNSTPKGTPKQPLLQPAFIKSLSPFKSVWSAIGFSHRA